MFASLDYIKKLYDYIYMLANKYFASGKFIKSLKYISNCAKLAYKFNWIYYDQNLENLLKENGNKLLKKTQISEQEEDNIIWIDSWGWEKRGLTTQYIEALTSLNKNIFFILISHEKFNPDNQNIKQTLSKSQNKVIHINPDKEIVKRLSNALLEIQNFNPSSLYLHIAPWATEALILTNAVEGIIKYNINLNDHTFWLGKDFVNYNIEFRDYGATVSTEKRGFKKKQLLKIPYYPIINDKNPFEGFNFNRDDNEIIILTGGSPYKYKGKNGFFFKMTDKILSLNSNAKLLIAGFDKDPYIENEISKMDNKNRIYIIGNRKDIDKVFEKCDIYLGSYPLSGGLMTCYAATYAKPIIAYAESNDLTNHLESLINIFASPFRTFENTEDLLKYSNDLLNNKEYRINEGIKIKNATITETKFRDLIAYFLKFKTSPLIFNFEKIDYSNFSNYILDRENTNLYELINFIFGITNTKYFICRLYLYKFIPFILHRKFYKLIHCLKFNHIL